MSIAAPGADSVPMASTSSTAPMSLSVSIPMGAARRAERRRRLPVNIPALILVVGGAVMQTIAFARATWLDSPSGKLGFSGLREWAQPGYAHAFVTWIAWILLAVTTVFGIAACVRWNGARIFRYAGALVGVAGAFMTLGAMLLLAYQTDDAFFHVARNYAAGIYLAVLGLLASTLGAAAGTGRRG